MWINIKFHGFFYSRHYNDTSNHCPAFLPAYECRATHSSAHKLRHKRDSWREPARWEQEVCMSLFHSEQLNWVQIWFTAFFLHIIPFLPFVFTSQLICCILYDLFKTLNHRFEHGSLFLIFLSFILEHRFVLLHIVQYIFCQTNSMLIIDEIEIKLMHCILVLWIQPMEEECMHRPISDNIHYLFIRA